MPQSNVKKGDKALQKPNREKNKMKKEERNRPQRTNERTLQQYKTKTELSIRALVEFFPSSSFSSSLFSVLYSTVCLLAKATVSITTKEIRGRQK